MLIRYLILLAALAGLVGCASGPDIDLGRYDKNLTPQSVAGNIGLHRDSEVVWGGLIVGINNLEGRTEIEVLGYPLVGKAEPNLSKEPTARFIVSTTDFIEPLVYSPGKAVTAAGRVTDTMEGSVGGARYTYPVLRPDDLYLWSEQRSRLQPQVGFGFGFVFGS